MHSKPAKSAGSDLKEASIVREASPGLPPSEALIHDAA